MLGMPGSWYSSRQKLRGPSGADLREMEEQGCPRPFFRAPKMPRALNVVYITAGFYASPTGFWSDPSLLGSYSSVLE